MPCYYPKQVWRTANGRNQVTGKWPISFHPPHPDNQHAQASLTIPCGQCIGCRLERSRQWAIRCVHEAQMHSENCFVTLTYNTENLQKINNILNKNHFILFMKRLRKRYGADIRFFHAGEYGSLNGNAHHHLCLFNFNFTDREFFQMREHVTLYRSKQLETLWQYGYSTIGDVTFESAAYIARYCLKKSISYGKQKEPDKEIPEYISMSRMPGIGKPWFDKYKSDVYTTDKIILRNLTCRPPKYYDNLYDRIDQAYLLQIKERRLSKVNQDDFTLDRLRVKETIKQLSIKQLKRKIEA